MQSLRFGNNSIYKIICLAAGCALLSGCHFSWTGSPGRHFSWTGGQGIKGSGHVVSETRAVSGFDRVALPGSGEMAIVQDDQESLTIETDDNLLPLIKSEVIGELLTIGAEHVNLRPSGTIRYTLHLKRLRQLQISGSVDVSAPWLKTDHLEVRISGSGNLHVTTLKADDLQVQISGSGDLVLGGKVTKQDVRISGSGTYNGADLESQTAVVQVSGSGNVSVWAGGALTASVSGSGNVKYYGTPQVNSHVSGSGGVYSLGNK